MSENALEQRGDDVLLTLKVSPNSGYFEIVGVNPWRNHLEVKVSSEARKGKANRELMSELESILGKPIELFSGVKSREKKVIVEDSTVEEVKGVLNLGEKPER